MLGLWEAWGASEISSKSLRVSWRRMCGDFFSLALIYGLPCEGWASYCYIFSFLSVPVRAVEERMNSSEDQVEYFYSPAAFLLEQYSFLRVYVRGSKIQVRSRYDLRAWTLRLCT